RRRLDLALAEAAVVQKRLQRLQDEQRGAAVTLRVRTGPDNVVWRDRCAHSRNATRTSTLKTATFPALECLKRPCSDSDHFSARCSYRLSPSRRSAPA